MLSKAKLDLQLLIVKNQLKYVRSQSEPRRGLERKTQEAFQLSSRSDASVVFLR